MTHLTQIQAVKQHGKVVRHADAAACGVHGCRLVSEGAPLLASFLLGAAGMVVGAALAWALVGRWMGPQGPALAACLTASYVGGTINFIATAQVGGGPAGVGGLAASVWGKGRKNWGVNA